jgi:hypothetical protein
MPLGSEVTLGSTLENLTGYEAPVVEVPVVDLAVESVTALNYKEVEVVFNTELDEDTVDPANFVSTDAGNSVEFAVLQEDGMTVILTLEDGEEFAAYDTFELTINDVVSAQEQEIAEDTVVSIDLVFDVTAPAVESVEVIGNKTLKVTYTEPVNHTASVTNYYIDGKLFAGSETIDGRVSTIAISAVKAADVYELTIRANKVDDFAGLYVPETVVEFVVEEDATAPTGVLTSATQVEVVIEFSEAIASATISAAAGTIDTETWSADDMTVTLAFDPAAPVPVNGTTITVADATDAYGNEAADFDLSTGNPTIDLTRPEVTDVVVNGQTDILVYFSEVVENDGTYTITDADDDATVLTAAYYTDDDAVEHKDILELTDVGAIASGTYTLTVEDETDSSPLYNGVVPYAATVVVADATKVEVDDVTVEGQVIFVTYDEEVDPATAIDPANYTFIVSNITKDITVEEVALLDDGMTVTITFSDEADTLDASDVDVIQIKGVQDLAANVITTVAYAAPFSAAPDAPLLTNVLVTGENTLTIDVVGDLVAATVAPTDFVIDANGTAISVIDVVYSAADDLLTLTINADLDAVGQFGGEDLDVDIDAAEVQGADVYGQTYDMDADGAGAADSAPITAVEGILPTVTAGDLAATDTEIVLTFSENMVVDSAALNLETLTSTTANGHNAASQFIVFVNDVQVAATYATTSDTVITITVAALAEDDVVKVQYVNNPEPEMNLVDAAGNTIANFALETTVSE